MMRFANRVAGAVCVLSAVVASVLSGCASTSSNAQQSGGTTNVSARMYSGFGNYSRPITTTSPKAQQWFNQGMQLLYGFNHDEAIRSFLQAAALDPTCAIAWWGAAYAYGLHINNPVMTEEQSRRGYEAAQEAMKRIDNASPAEQALIRAIATRYAWPAPADRTALDQAYAAAMEEAHRAFPDDPDIAALFAESLMDMQPWNYWTHDGEPKGRIEEIVGVLEGAMADAPNHPGANHFYIHAVEASKTPERANAAADRLRNLVPGSGHLVHMPSHIDIRTGRYEAAALANERAIKSDEAYFALAPPPRFYRIYFIHNLHFLAYTSMMEGRYQSAIAAARKVEAKVPDAFLREYAKVADGLMPVTFHVMVRFGKWNELLNEPEPADYRLMSRAMRRYARCVALAALDRTEEAAVELEAFDAVVAGSGESEGVTDEWFVGNNPAKVILTIARTMAEGELMYRRGEHEAAFAKLREAIAMQDALTYDEPPGWMMPVRHALGALLLGAAHDGVATSGEVSGGRDAILGWAEAVYREDLGRHPNNAWSLLGLENALRAQGKDRMDEVRELEPLRAKAWMRADVSPTSSCYCQPYVRRDDPRLPF